MIRLFLKNVLRSLLVSVIVYLIAGILTVVLAVVWDLIFVDALNMEYLELLRVPRLMIMCSVIGLIAGFLAAFLCPFRDTAHGHYPRVAGLIFMLLPIVLLFGGSGAFCGYYFYGEIVSLCESSEVYIMLVLVPPALFTSQLAYFICGCLKYGAENSCPQCKRVFCLTDTGSVKTGDEYDTYSHTDTTRNEKIGSIGSIEVHANVTERTYYKTHYTGYKVYCKCKRCGYEGSYISYKSKTTFY